MKETGWAKTCEESSKRCLSSKSKGLQKVQIHNDKGFQKWPGKAGCFALRSYDDIFILGWGQIFIYCRYMKL